MLSNIRNFFTPPSSLWHPQYYNKKSDTEFSHGLYPGYKFIQLDRKTYKITCLGVEYKCMLINKVDELECRVTYLNYGKELNKSVVFQYGKPVSHDCDERLFMLVCMLVRMHAISSGPPTKAEIEANREQNAKLFAMCSNRNQDYKEIEKLINSDNKIKWNLLAAFTIALNQAKVSGDYSCVKVFVSKDDTLKSRLAVLIKENHAEDKLDDYAKRIRDSENSFD
jgi:hypothetical protein